MSTVGGKHKLVGFVDLGKGHELMNILSGNLHENAYINLQQYKQFKRITDVCCSSLTAIKIVKQLRLA